MAEEKRIGRQTPTNSVVLPYTKSRGQEAIDLYSQAGSELLEWQQLLLYDIMAVGNEGLWVHQKFGYSVPRRNGKSEDALAICLWALKKNLRLLYTAHRTSTAHAIWERLEYKCGKAGIEITSSFKAFGKEHLYTEEGGVAEFRTRTSNGGLGEGYDILIIDEAQEYTDAQESSLKYIVSDSDNPLTILFGTPPTAVSAGTVFVKMRERVLSGKGFEMGWEEWGVERMSDPNDAELWYQTNPSLGTILTERKIRAEIGDDDIDFNIQRLGLWLTYNQKSEISKNEWESLKIEQTPDFTGKLFVGIKFGHDGKNVSVSIAVRIKDSKEIYVETIDCRPVKAGMDWILQLLSVMDYSKVVIDGKNGQELLASNMKDARLKPPILPTVKQVISANTDFELSLAGGDIRHNNQPSLTQTISNCRRRSIGNSGGFGYESLNENVDISLMDSVILAHWICKETKAKPKKQRVSY